MRHFLVKERGNHDNKGTTSLSEKPERQLEPLVSYGKYISIMSSFIIEINDPLITYLFKCA